MVQEHAPPPALARFVECIWTTQTTTPAGHARLNRVLPDGCIDFIFNYGDLPDPAGMPHHALRAYVVGTMTTALAVRQRGNVDVIGIRFRPGGASAFLGGLPAHELTARAVDLHSAAPRFAEWAEGLADTPPAHRPALLARALTARLDHGSADRRVTATAALIAESRGTVTLDTLLDRTAMSRRQLERLFLRHVGISPKFACSIARFRAAAGFVRATCLPLARIAAQTGYHDQPHLTRDFARLAGITPAGYRRECAVASVQDAHAAAV